jgi:hypothetical protein
MTAHRTSTLGAFVEFMTIAKKIEYIGRLSLLPSPSSSSQSTVSRLEVSVDNQKEVVVLASTPIEGDSRVLWSKTFDDQDRKDGEGKGSTLHVVKITNVDGGELELDYVT